MVKAKMLLINSIMVQMRLLAVAAAESNREKNVVLGSSLEMLNA
jgi:hypothetical protein